MHWAEDQVLTLQMEKLHAPLGLPHVAPSASLAQRWARCSRTPWMRRPCATCSSRRWRASLPWRSSPLWQTGCWRMQTFGWCRCCTWPSTPCPACGTRRQPCCTSCCLWRRRASCAAWQVTSMATAAAAAGRLQRAGTAAASQSRLPSRTTSPAPRRSWSLAPPCCAKLLARCLAASVWSGCGGRSSSARLPQLATAAAAALSSCSRRTHQCPAGRQTWRGPPWEPSGACSRRRWQPRGWLRWRPRRTTGSAGRPCTA